MFYRRKILLALVEIFGGSLTRTDLQKLLFLYCQHTKNNYFDFFPYNYGCFSFLATQDKSVLEKYGYLNQDENFVLAKNISIIDELKINDKNNLNYFYNTYKNLKGKELIRHSYLEFPEYTIKSKILSDILNSKEISQVQNWWNNDNSSRMFSIGYEGLTIDSYLNKLVFRNIKALVDVRKNPLSMKYGFSKTRLRNYLEKAGIKYFHIPQLGIPSDLRKNLENPDDYKKLFYYYSLNILPDKLKELNEIHSILKKYKRVTLTCFEKDHKFCHRQKITEYFETSKQHQFPVSHI